MPMTSEPSPAPRGAKRPATGVRSADAVNEEIRALWLCAGGRLSPEQRRRYEGLVTEWSAAVRDAHPEADTATAHDAKAGRTAEAGAGAGAA